MRRRSSVGKLDLGDNTGPSLSTMHTLKQLKIKHLFTNLAYRQTWFIPLVILLTTSGSYYFSGNHTATNPLHKFICPSYEIPGTNPPYYGKGKKDFCFVFFYMIFFTFYREFLMQVVLQPLAVFCGLRSYGKMKRFMEQAYSMCYYGLSSPYGIYIMYYSDLWFFKTTPFYVDYPHKEHQFHFKVYYLLQAAFWAQQSVVLMLQLEKPRKDFKELVFHHIITMSLIFLSYRFHFTWVGLEVYITMDVSDFFLAASKTLNYLESVFVPPFFTVFIFVWVYTRHYLNLKILWSILTEFRTVGDYTLNWETQQYKCWISQVISFTLISGLQLVNAYWLFLILRIAYRLVATGEQKDDRSDDESDDERISSDSSGTTAVDITTEDTKKTK